MSHPRKRPRIVWTDAEKAMIIDEALNVQRSRADLAGLPLLKAAIKSLPEGRRRRVIPLPQTPWFELALQRRADVMTQAQKGGIERHLAEITAMLGRIVELLSELNAWRPNVIYNLRRGTPPRTR